MADKRIGEIKADGSRVWPETDVMGGGYDRPCTTCDLDQSRFVVLPVNYVDNGTLDELRGAGKRLEVFKAPEKGKHADSE